MRGFPSGPEAILLHSKAGYMYATFLWVPVKLFPCNAGRTIYDPMLLACSLEIATEQQDKLISGVYDYGFKPSSSSGIILEGYGNAKTFAATAKHAISKRSFRIDLSGEIVTIETKGGE